MIAPKDGARRQGGITRVCSLANTGRLRRARLWESRPAAAEALELCDRMFGPREGARTELIEEEINSDQQRSGEGIGAGDEFDAIDATGLCWPGTRTGPRSFSAPSCWCDSPRHILGRAFQGVKRVRPLERARLNITGPTAPWLSREVMITCCFTGDGPDSPVGTAGEVSKPIASATIADLTANITSPSLKRTIGFGEDLARSQMQTIKTAYLTVRARSSSASDILHQAILSVLSDHEMLN